MVMGTGIDIIEVRRVASALEQARFQERVYTPQERAYCDGRGRQRICSYAARWAAKEAVLKAFGTGLRQGTLQDIAISHDAAGCPQVVLTGYFAALAAERGIQTVHISLSHVHDYAVAQCVMEGVAL